MRRWLVVAAGVFLLLSFASQTLLSLMVWQAQESAHFEVRADVPYGQVDGHTLLLDLYLPKDDGKGLRPAVVVIHGGAWRSGNKTQLRQIAEMFARRGYVAAAINYRLAPKWSYPAQLDDCQRVVRWLRKRAKEFSIDPKRFGAAGASAGGHLSALLGTRETRDDTDPELKGISSKVQCVLDIFGPTDFTDEGYVKASRTLLPGKILLDFLGKPYDEAPDIWRDASPLFHVSHDDAPFFIIHGTEDQLVPVEHSNRIAEALQKVGVEVKLVIIEGMGHGPTDPKSREQFMKALNDSVDFFDKHLKQKAGGG